MNLDISFGYEFLDDKTISLDEWKKYCTHITNITDYVLDNKYPKIDNYNLNKLIEIQKVKIKAFCIGLRNHPLEGYLQVLSCVIYKLLNYLNGNNVDVKDVLIELFGNTVPCIIEKWYPMYEKNIEGFYQKMISNLNQ